LRTTSGDPYAGEEIYVQRCASCHRLFFKGGDIGPDLTIYPRDQTSLLLRAIVEPNAEIREGYEHHLVILRDGRVLGGILLERDAKVLVLRTMEGEDLVLDLDTVEMWEPTGQSLMPEGLLDDLEAQEVRNLFAYLRISQPIRR
jgi:putative heme-binding domain-containing protein